jgi:hypothetical protein
MSLRQMKWICAWIVFELPLLYLWTFSHLPQSVFLIISAGISDTFVFAFSRHGSGRSFLLARRLTWLELFESKEGVNVILYKSTSGEKMGYRLLTLQSRLFLTQKEHAGCSNTSATSPTRNQSKATFCTFPFGCPRIR